MSEPITWTEKNGTHPGGVAFTREGENVVVTVRSRSFNNLTPGAKGEISMPLEEFKKLMISFMREVRG